MNNINGLLRGGEQRMKTIRRGVSDWRMKGKPR